MTYLPFTFGTLKVFYRGTYLLFLKSDTETTSCIDRLNVTVSFHVYDPERPLKLCCAHRGQRELRSAAQDEERRRRLEAGPAALAKRPEENQTPPLLHQRTLLQPQGDA